MRLEELEDRAVPATPTIVSVSPSDGALLGAHGNITVKFNENVTGAGTASNFELFAADGTPITIGALSYSSTTFTTTITGSQLKENGAALTAGTYSLFIVGDQIKDAATGTLLRQPGQLVVANVGQGSLSTTSTIGSGLGAAQTINLPPLSGVAYSPTAIASADLTGDGTPDLIVASAGQNTINIYAGNSTGGFDTTPDLTLNLLLWSGPHKRRWWSPTSTATVCSTSRSPTASPET